MKTRTATASCLSLLAWALLILLALFFFPGPA